MDRLVVRARRWEYALVIPGTPLVMFALIVSDGEVAGRWLWVAFFALGFMASLAFLIWPSKLIIDEQGVEQVHINWSFRLPWKQIDRVVLRDRRIILLAREGPWGHRRVFKAWPYKSDEQPLADNWAMKPKALHETLLVWQARAGRSSLDRDD